MPSAVAILVPSSLLAPFADAVEGTYDALADRGERECGLVVGLQVQGPGAVTLEVPGSDQATQLAGLAGYAVSSQLGEGGHTPTAVHGEEDLDHTGFGDQIERWRPYAVAVAHRGSPSTRPENVVELYIGVNL